MSNLKEIDDAFVDEYILTHRNELSKSTIGGTDWRFADIVAPAFKEVLEIAQPKSILEVGFNKGASALMFLSIDPTLEYNSVDIEKREKSVKFLQNKFKYFWFYQNDSKYLNPESGWYKKEYDLIFLDGDHSKEGVINDIEKSLLFKPKYILLDDFRHPSHRHIETIVTEDYSDKLEVVKVFEFNQCWQGYSMALCKVK